jgi:hypothetical protein
VCGNSSRRLASVARLRIVTVHRMTWETTSSHASRCSRPYSSASCTATERLLDHPAQQVGTVSVSLQTQVGLVQLTRLLSRSINCRPGGVCPVSVSCPHQNVNCQRTVRGLEYLPLKSTRNAAFWNVSRVTLVRTDVSEELRRNLYFFAACVDC